MLTTASHVIYHREECTYHGEADSFLSQKEFPITERVPYHRKECTYHGEAVGEIPTEGRGPEKRESFHTYACVMSCVM